MDDFHKLFRDHRKKSGLTQKELADLAGVGKTAVFDFEKGKESIQLNTFLKIAQALNIKLTLTGPLIHKEKNI